MPVESNFASIRIHYDIRSIQENVQKSVFDCEHIQPIHLLTLQHDAAALHHAAQSVLFTSDCILCAVKELFCYELKGCHRIFVPISIDTKSYAGRTQFLSRYESVFFQLTGLKEKWDAVDCWSPLRFVKFIWSRDEVLSQRGKVPIVIIAVNSESAQRVPLRFHQYRFQNMRLRNRWNALTNALAALSLRWDAVKKEFVTLPFHYQSLVRSGWRIIARNIVTDELIDLGFIDTDSIDRSLTDIELPDGNYEISVLTSSLFWQDVMDRNIRTISICPETEITPLPTIYNLRSTISQGQRIIEWSANQSEIDDCVFGLWFSPDSPVGTNRPADNTVWYYPSQTEYRTTFNQNAPAYVAVAAMRPGNEPEMGNVHELYLDWCHVSPRAPDDVILFDAPLPAMDSNIANQYEDDPTLTLWM